MIRWKSEAVVAWLELVMKMPMYSKSCADNVKSGKVRGKHIGVTGAGRIWAAKGFYQSPLAFECTIVHSS